MWLRDSSAQVNHYLPFVKEDQQLAAVISGLIKKQMKFILLDPYAMPLIKNRSMKENIMILLSCILLSGKESMK